MPRQIRAGRSSSYLLNPSIARPYKGPTGLTPSSEPGSGSYVLPQPSLRPKSRPPPQALPQLVANGAELAKAGEVKEKKYQGIILFRARS